MVRIRSSSTAGRITLEFEHLELADAVFGAEAAAELRTRSWMARLRFLFDRLELEGLRAGPLVDVEMQVAVAEMAVGHEHTLRNVLRHPGARRLR